MSFSPDTKSLLTGEEVASALVSLGVDPDARRIDALLARIDVTALPAGDRQTAVRRAVEAASRAIEEGARHEPIAATAGDEATPPLRVCLHVTSADFVPSILRDGLQQKVGPLSEQVDEQPGIFMFPTWDHMMDGNWLFNEAWPHAAEPALLAVDVTGLALDLEAGYEAVCRQAIAADRIVVLAPGELDWDPDAFVAMGGHLTFDVAGHVPRSIEAASGQRVGDGERLNDTARAILNAAQRMQASQVLIEVDRARLTVKIDARSVPHITQGGVFTLEGERADGMLSEARAHVDIASTKRVTLREAMASAVAGYLDDFIEPTTPAQYAPASGLGGAIDVEAAAQIIGDAMYGQLPGGEVEVEAAGDGRSVEIVRIMAGVEARGDGSRAMAAAISVADALGVRLTLTASGSYYDNARTAEARLQRFYARFGFEVMGDGTMARESQPVAPAARPDAGAVAKQADPDPSPGW